MKGTRIYARGAQMEALIEEVGPSPAAYPVRSKYVTGEQMERLIALVNGDPPTYPVRSKYATGEQMERLISALGGSPATYPVWSKYATAEQMERAIAAAGGDLPTQPVPSKYITAEQMLRLIAAMEVTDPLSELTGPVVAFMSSRTRPFEALTVELEPVQDLHGQSAPYPAGGSKNLFDPDAVTDGYYISATGVITESENSCYSDLIPVTAGQSYTYSGHCGGTGSNNKRIHAYASGVWQEQITSQSVNSGTDFSITFTVPEGADGLRISAFMSDTNRQFEAGPSATSYAPYSNVCPITGRTGATVHHWGLPTGYTPADYVTITAAISGIEIAALDTFDRDDLVIDCTWMSTSYGQYKAIYSCKYLGEAYNITRLIYRTASTDYLVNNHQKTSAGTALYGLPGSKWHTIRSWFGGGIKDGSSYTSVTTQGTANSNNILSLGHSGCNISFRDFSIRSTDASGHERFIQLIPCTDPDGVAGFYDTVGQHFYTTEDPDNISATGLPVQIVHDNENQYQFDWSNSFYRQIKDIAFDGTFYFDTGVKLIGSDVVTMTITPTGTGGQNLFGAYSGTPEAGYHFSMYIYNSTSSQCYFRYNDALARPILGTGKRTITFGAGGTTGFKTDATVTEQTFTTAESAQIGALPLSAASKYTGTIHGPITVGTRLKYVPCERVSDGAIGYYEVYSGTFLTATGAGTPTTSGYETDSNIDADFTNKANAIYGGTLDVLAGTITPKYMYVKGLGSTIVSYSGYKCLRTEMPSETSQYIETTSNMFKFGTVNAPWRIRQPSAGVLYWFFPSDWTDDQILAISPNVEYLMYIKDAYKVPVQLTPYAVETYEGANVLWCDAADTTVTVYGTEITEPDADALMALNLLLGGRYQNMGRPEDVSDPEALDIILGGNTR